MKPTYLVVLRTTLDDLPILSTPSYQRAYAKARSVTEAEAGQAAKVMDVDHAGRVCTAVVAFHGDGTPNYARIVKDWEIRGSKRPPKGAAQGAAQLG